MSAEGTTRGLWWADLDSHSPRYADWREILGGDRVPLKSPASGQTQLGEEKADVYLLDWPNLTDVVKERLCLFLARKFKTTADVVRAELEANGCPIRAADIIVCFDLRAFL